ncbi:hypothetical protein AX16_001216 [Volvariella volvacea WC 439]|nr:hypothetical protein AX16_001216 [Volvariella volvacea WC 439]
MNPSASRAASVVPQQFPEGWTPEQIAAWQNEMWGQGSQNQAPVAGPSRLPGWNAPSHRSTTASPMTQLSQQMQGMQTSGADLQQWRDFYAARGFYPPQNNVQAQLQPQTQPLPPPAQPSPQRPPSRRPLPPHPGLAPYVAPQDIAGESPRHYNWMGQARMEFRAMDSRDRVVCPTPIKEWDGNCSHFHKWFGAVKMAMALYPNDVQKIYVALFHLSQQEKCQVYTEPRIRQFTQWIEDQMNIVPCPWSGAAAIRGSRAAQDQDEDRRIGGRVQPTVGFSSGTVGLDRGSAGCAVSGCPYG